jgi:hypothetical protein
MRPFLSRLPSITSSCFSRIRLCKNSQSPSVSNSFPCLTQLTAMSWMVARLLQRLIQNSVPLLATVNILLQFGVEHNFDDALQAVATHPPYCISDINRRQARGVVLVLTRRKCEAQSARILPSLNYTRSVGIHATDVGDPFREAFRRWFYLFPCLEHITLGFCQLSARLELSVEESRDNNFH